MKLVLVCDYGLDDAAATVDALSHAKADGYGEVYLVAVGGNVPASVALRNAKKLLARLQFDMPKVTVVSTADIPQREEFLKEIHGGDGMGDLFADAPCRAETLGYEEFLTAPVGEFVLVSLGPMTLIPPILKKEGCKKFLFMGGNIAEIPNFHGYEFNHALNREAFAEAVLRPHIAITMDTCRDPLFNIQDKEIEGEGIAFDVARRSRRLSLSSGEKGCFVWDDIAIKCLRHPNWFETYQAVDKDGNRLTVARYIGKREYLEIITE